MREAGAVDASGNVALDSGVVFFDAASTRALLKLCAGPLRGATAMGTAAEACRVELYSDVLQERPRGYDFLPRRVAGRPDVDIPWRRIAATSRLRRG